MTFNYDPPPVTDDHALVGGKLSTGNHWLEVRAWARDRLAVTADKPRSLGSFTFKMVMIKFI